MHRSVVEAWHTISEPLEGRVQWLYADVKQLLTAGVGNLADPVSLAQQMPWRMPDGELATKEEIARQWRAVKDQASYLSKRHYKYAASFSTIRLSNSDIDQFVARRLAITERSMLKHFPGWHAFPADAQLGCLSMAWAVGDGFPTIFKHFTRAANASNWAGASASCKIKEAGNPGVVPRNKNNRLCFANAQRGLELGTPIDRLFWPGEAADIAPQVVVDGITAADRARASAMFADYARKLTAEGVEDAFDELAHGIDRLQQRYEPEDDQDDDTLPPDPAPDTERPTS